MEKIHEIAFITHPYLTVLGTYTRPYNEIVARKWIELSLFGQLTSTTLYNKVFSAIALRFDDLVASFWTSMVFRIACDFITHKSFVFSFLLLDFSRIKYMV